MKGVLIGMAIIAALAALILGGKGPATQGSAKIGQEAKPTASGPTDTATFGAGCFWCVEAVFQNLKGVQSVVSGYAGGTVRNPTYEDVCSGQTGHAEACQIAYDPAVISYPELLEAFWKSHDPTTLNRQGNDVGT